MACDGAAGGVEATPLEAVRVAEAELEKLELALKLLASVGE